MQERSVYMSEQEAKSWRRNIQRGEAIQPESYSIGLPVDPVVAVPFVDDPPAEAIPYEARTHANGGVVLVQHQIPAEAALNAALRPQTDIIEVGADPDHDLVDKIQNNDGRFVLNNQSIEGNLHDVVGRVIAAKGIQRVVMHQQDPRIAELARSWGINYAERWDLFQQYATKTGFNQALKDHKRDNPRSPLGPLGIPIGSAEQVVMEHRRLAARGAESIIKFDFSSEGLVRAGTTDPLILTPDLSDEQVLNKFQEYCQREGIKNPSCEMQLRIDPHAVYSVSSGRIGNEFVPFESHVQSQHNGAADGASPLMKNAYTEEMFRNVWPEINALFLKMGITGNQNLNMLLMPDDLHRLAQEIYNDPHLSNTVPIDFNYRPISGFLNAASRYREDTGRPLNRQNFISSSINVAPVYAANPHAIFMQADRIGLRGGRNGNFTLVNASKFTPDKMSRGATVRAQFIVDGTDSHMTPEDSLHRLEEIIANNGTIDELQGIDRVHPDETVSMNEHEYRMWMTEQLRTVIQ